MRIDVHIHTDSDPATERKLVQIIDALHALTGKVTKMAGELERLTTEVSETRTVIDSAIVLIGGLADEIRRLATDPAALNALADSLDAKEKELAAAVAANTPTPPAP